MIDVYFRPTGNGRKTTVMLEERALPYDVIPVNINKGDQRFRTEVSRLYQVMDKQLAGNGAVGARHP